MAEFLKALPDTLKYEGGLSTNTSDKGNAGGKVTYAGISEAYWPTWKGWPYVKAAMAEYKTTAEINKYLASNSQVQALVEQFYKDNFWDTLSLDRVNNQQLANVVFDFGVNTGIGTAAKKLQMAVNGICGSLTVDGQIGSKTIAAVNKLDAKTLYDAFNAERKKYYEAIVANNPSQKQFLGSWLNRIKPYIS